MTIETQTVTDRISTFIARTRLETLPDAAVERAEVHILDTLGAMISGATLRPGQAVGGWVRNEGGRPVSTVVTHGFRTSPALAAMANGAMAHADETDDAHFSSLTHPGASIVPAVLAVAEERHSDGASVVAAVVVGYDLIARISKAIDGPTMTRRGFNGTSISGSVAAAGAVANLLRLGHDETRYALSYAATQASGISSWRLDREHIQKALSFGGFPARNGVTAALMAAAGFTAAEDTFDGPHNMLRPYLAEPRPDFLTDGLEETYEIHDTSIKKYPAGQPLQAALEGLFALVAAHPLSPDEVAEIVVRLPEGQARTVNDRAMPDVNAQFLLAVGLLDGRVDFHSSHDFERMHDPRVVALKERIRLVGDPDLSRNYPAERKAIVEIQTTEGEVHSITIDRAPGTPRNPMSRDDVARKFHGLVDEVIGRDVADEVARATLGLRNAPDIAELMGRLTSRR